MNEIKLTGCKNVRDLGGIPVKDGIVKSGKFIRGACLDALTKNDILKLVNDYNLSTIIDLRTEREKLDRPDIEISNVKYMHMPIFNNRFPGITHETQEDFDRDFKEYKLDLAKMYGGMLKEEYLEKVANIVRTIVNLPDNEYAVFFHCTEGKDRTGLIAALILLILGADRQAIIENYLETNKINQKKAEKIYWKVRILGRNKEKAQNMRNIFLAKIEYINVAFDVIDKDWKDLDDFIENGLKITKEEIKNLKEKVIE